ncbi:hypothetical protein [Flavobacterium sp.]|uniref:hypothetical protein n=1 Tax=Flavobacterium sp. TaxID=239 RepID=UPI003B992D4D
MKPLLFAATLFYVLPGAANELQTAVAELNLALEQRLHQSALELKSINLEIDYISRQLVVETNNQNIVHYLKANELLRIKKKRVIAELQFDISKIRYLKGVQIIRLLYEKVLSLDHHFASVRTLGEIHKISNPTQYAEYQKLRDYISSKRDKKNNVDLSTVLATNPVVSLVNTFTNMISSNLNKEEKEKELTNIECILDFTLRMQNDLNTIYFETAYLTTSNSRIKQEIEVLFKDYTKPVNYSETLEKCRANDDWDALTQKMEEYLAKMKTAQGSAQYKMQVNIEFPVDRLLQFINQYNVFIDQGGKFYEKFRIILNSYENAQRCETKLPSEFQKMRADIDVAINKFNVAYKPVEINGSKMKEILYGLNEFE